MKIRFVSCEYIRIETKSSIAYIKLCFENTPVWLSPLNVAVFDLIAPSD